MDMDERDRRILRELAKKTAEIASLPVQKEKAAMWKSLNSLKRVKPMIWINEIPWHEMDVNHELRLQTTNEFCRFYEWQLRSTIYQWEHMPGDMVVEPVIYSPLAIQDTGFEITEEVDILRTDERSSVVSRHFHIQIQEESDLEKIKMPVVSHDEAATQQHYEMTEELFGDILRVEKRGAPGFWFAPWDELIRWWGVQEALTDLYLNPELVHKAMERLVAAYLHRLDQYEQMQLLSLNNRNDRVGSGGYGYTDELPKPGFNPDHVTTEHLWGCGTAQIFSDVSPRMHEEFALQYEIRWMQRFALNYYGCCEPLHKKIDILEKIPNLRKISMSRWIDVDEATSNIGDKYVFSYKPNPAIFAEDSWHPDVAREELIKVLTKAKEKGCIVEIIMKDISTVRYKPHRLWEWAEMAQEVAAEFQ